MIDFIQKLYLFGDEEEVWQAKGIHFHKISGNLFNLLFITNMSRISLLLHYTEGEAQGQVLI